MQSFFSYPQDVWIRRIRVVKNAAPVKAVVDVTVRGVEVDGYLIVLTREGLSVRSPMARYSVHGETRYKQVVKLLPDLQQDLNQKIILTFRKKYL